MKHKLFLACIFCSICFSTLTAQTLTGDPWIFQVYKELWGRQPSAWELNINNYNSGSWNNYGELKNYIKDYQYSLQSQSYKTSVVSVANNRSVVGFYQNGQQIAVTLIGNDGGTLISNDVARLIGNDSAGSPASLVGNDGASIQLKNMAGVYFGSMYGTLSAGSKRIKTSGKGSIIIRK